jgi:hypothetical protein
MYVCNIYAIWRPVFCLFADFFVCCLINDAVISLVYIASSAAMINERWIGKDVEKIVMAISGHYPGSRLKKLGKIRQILVRIAGFPVWIRTGHLPITT